MVFSSGILHFSGMTSETPAFSPASRSAEDALWFRSAGRLSGDADYVHTLRDGVPLLTLFLHRKGRGCFRLGDTVLKAREQTATVLFPSSCTTTWRTVEAPWEFFWLTCGGSQCLSYLSQFGLNSGQPERRIEIAASNRLEDLWQRLIASGRAINVRTHFTFQRMAMCVLLSLLEAVSFNTEAKPDRKIYGKDLVHTVDCYLARPRPLPDRVDEVAALFHSTPEHVSRVFKQTVGIALKDYMIGHRINQAKQLLAETAESVEAVGEQVGYPDVYHFSRLFKNRVGTSPMQFRRNYWH